MISLPNFATGDKYTGASTRLQAETVRVNVLVANATVYLQTCDNQGNFSFDEEFLVPGGYSFDRSCGGARIRSGAVGVPAQVSMTLLQKGDVG